MIEAPKHFRQVVFCIHIAVEAAEDGLIAIVARPFEMMLIQEFEETLFPVVLAVGFVIHLGLIKYDAPEINFFGPYFLGRHIHHRFESVELLPIDVFPLDRIREAERRVSIGNSFRE